jgi:hypothetical protein
MYVYVCSSGLDSRLRYTHAILLGLRAEPASPDVLGLRLRVHVHSRRFRSRSSPSPGAAQPRPVLLPGPVHSSRDTALQRIRAVPTHQWVDADRCDGGEHPSSQPAGQGDCRVLHREAAARRQG